MKKIGIEQLLTWAFTQELPKIGARSESVLSAAPSSWNVMSDMIALGTMVDKGPNRYGVVSGFVHEGDPHPDAMIVGNAVRGLAAHGGFEIGKGWNPYPGFTDEHGIIAAEVARVVSDQMERSDKINGRYMVNLVTSAAILKRGPCWLAEEPRVVMVMNSGKPAWFVQRKMRDGCGRTIPYEDNGFDQHKGRPKVGAYRKYRIASPIRSAIVARMDWQLWQSSLLYLRNTLASELSAHDLQPFTPDREPWRYHR